MRWFKRNFSLPSAFVILVFVAFMALVFVGCSKKNVTIYVTDENVSVAYGADMLAGKLGELGYDVNVVHNLKDSPEGLVVELLVANDVLEHVNDSRTAEAFSIKSDENTIYITGSDASGVLYGCIELGEQAQKKGELTADVDFLDKPDMVLRGTCIGLQKTEYLPGRHVYEYPYTPENFPWFYDKQHWIEYLDMMVENRYNSLYLWNGHPFASLVKLDDYPYAVEVDEETFKKNEEVFAFLAEEAEKRGIWVIQMFYNILVSKPFAEHHNMKTQDRGRPIIPVISDYTRKSVAAFIEKYPHV
ncbi:MAG: hypothetical protein PF436_02180, partial [Prolixibacteraceae bacterium]|nr:hypothetical protein [Prolixibacteraceae bacterium]